MRVAMADEALAPGDTPGRVVLVAGNYPPVRGPATAATLAAVRDVWDHGDQTVVVAARSGAADIVATVAGPLAGWRLDQLRRRSGASAAVLVLQAELPYRPMPRSAPAARFVAHLATTASLLWAIRNFDEVSLVLAGHIGVSPRIWRPLCAGQRRVFAIDAALAECAGIPVGSVSILERVSGPLGLPEPGVSVLGPPEVPWRSMPRYAAGRLGRAVLGPYFLRLRMRVLINLDRAHRLYRRLGPSS